MFSWKLLHNRAFLKTATISNHSEKNLPCMHPQLKVGHERIHLQLGAQKYTQNVSKPTVSHSSSFHSFSFQLYSHAFFSTISSFIYPFSIHVAKLSPALIPLAAWLLILNLSQITDLADPSVWLRSFCIKSYNFLIWVTQSQQWEH